MISFNVLYMPGSVSRLLPLALSLLQAPEVRIRLVANGCHADEVEFLRAATEIDERLSLYVLPQQNPVEHGRALNHLFQRFDEPRFAFIDSDVVASGDFMAGLLPIPPGTSVFDAPPVWLRDEEAVLSTEGRYVGGHRRVLSDGTAIGSTFMAVYERAAVEPLWRQLPRGFGVNYRYLLPKPIRRAFSERGWRFEIFDSCRVLNLMLVLAGHRLENRAIPELSHIGSYSVRRFVGRAAAARDLIGLMRPGPGRTLRMIVGTSAYVMQARWWRRGDPERLPLMQRRPPVLAYIDEALDAIVAGRALPSAPRTDSGDVDRRVRALIATLQEQYPANLSALERARAGRPVPASPSPPPA